MMNIVQCFSSISIVNVTIDTHGAHVYIFVFNVFYLFFIPMFLSHYYRMHNQPPRIRPLRLIIGLFEQFVFSLSRRIFFTKISIQRLKSIRLRIFFDEQSPLVHTIPVAKKKH